MASQKFITGKFDTEFMGRVKKNDEWIMYVVEEEPKDIESVKLVTGTIYYNDLNGGIQEIQIRHDSHELNGAYAPLSISSPSLCCQHLHLHECQVLGRLSPFRCATCAIFGIGCG